jgi:hypothetical protein
MKHAEHSDEGIFHIWNYASHFVFLEPYNCWNMLGYVMSAI